MSEPGAVAAVLAGAKHHHGLIRRGEAYAGGLSSKVLRSLTRNGVVEPVAPQIMRICGAPDTWDQRVLIAVWAGGSQCWATGETAAALHSFDGVSCADVVHVVVAEQGRGYRRTGVRVHATSVVLPEDRSFVRGIPCLDPIRTWLMLAASVPQDRLEELLDAAERDGKIRRDDLQRRLSRLQVSGRNGTGIAASLLHDREPIGSAPTNPFERRFVRLMEASELGGGVSQYQVRRGDGRMAFIDYAWPELQCGVELDGHVAHATRAQRSSDNERQRAIQDAGFELIRFTWEEFRHSPEAVAASVRTMLVRRNRGFARVGAPVWALPEDQKRWEWVELG